MKKVLITGIGGFVGYHLVNYLKEQKKFEIYGTKLEFEECNLSGIEIYNMDITNIKEVESVILKIKPDYIYHLAAQSSVKRSWEDPVDTININIIGTVNLLETIRKNNINAKILLIGSSEEYGRAFEKNSSLSEDIKCIPENFYALTKNTQNQIGYLYSKAYDMNIVMTRSFNHIGIKQSPIFVVSDFCRQVAQIELGKKEAIIEVGNLSAYRDFTDVRDIVRAYAEIIEKGGPGETYNIGSGKSFSIQTILDEIIKLSKKDIIVKIDESKYRKLDIEKTEANINKITQAINWKPNINMNDSLRDIIDYWRKEENKEEN